MQRLALVIICLCAGLHAQAPVNVSAGPPPAPSWSSLYDYDGSGNIIYIGQAQTFQQTANVISRSATTLTNIVVSSNTATVTCASACGAWPKMRVTITGATVDTDLNATYTILTTPSSTTYTFTTANVGNATYTESTLAISTNNPLTTQEVWTVEVLSYNVSNKQTVDSWANNFKAIAWDNRTTY